MKVITLNKIKQYPESLRNSAGLVSLTIIIFFTFFFLNIIFGPGKNEELKISENNVLKEKEDQLIETLPRGVLTFYKASIGQKLSAEDYKIVCNKTS